MTTATQLRNTLIYVLHNARRHGERVSGVDIFSSARYFDGFSKDIALGPAEPGPVPVAEATTTLLRSRWRYIGLIDPSETPAAALKG